MSVAKARLGQSASRAQTQVCSVAVEREEGVGGWVGVSVWLPVYGPGETATRDRIDHTQSARLLLFVDMYSRKAF